MHDLERNPYRAREDVKSQEELVVLVEIVSKSKPTNRCKDRDGPEVGADLSESPCDRIPLNGATVSMSDDKTTIQSQVEL